ncbi:MAG: HAMP domain-containing histidine kinase [Bacteriovoracaceae bacterium]|nr:HAMP domain-containing histidine kinase [Bacteriovoracaceae bacterium]
MLTKIAKKFIHQSHLTDQTFIYKTRALLILWAATTTVMWLYVFYCYKAFHGTNQTVVIGGTIFSILHTLSPLIFLLTQSFSVTGLWISLTGLSFQTLFCLYSGGAHSPSTIWLSFHPVILAFFGNIPLIIFSVILNTFIIITMVILGQYGFLPPNILPSLFRDGMIVTSYIGLDVLVALFTILAIRFNNSKNKELSESKELTENLVRILCHDINNPLTTMKISASLLNPEKGELNPKVLARLNRSIQDVQNIIQSVHMWNVHKDGKITLKNEQIPVAELLEHIHNSFPERLQQKSITYQVNCQANENAMIIGDRTAVFYQIINNLLSNAIKFSYENSQIMIDLFEQDNFLVFEIRDQGMGIDPDHTEKVFSPYIPTSKNGTNNEKGTGFGLPIVATIVQKMGGKISIHNRRIEDNAESGTLVKLLLPL